MSRYRNNGDWQLKHRFVVFAHWCSYLSRRKWSKWQLVDLNFQIDGLVIVVLKIICQYNKKFYKEMDKLKNHIQINVLIINRLHTRIKCRTLMMTLVLSDGDVCGTLTWQPKQIGCFWFWPHPRISVSHKIKIDFVLRVWSYE